MPSDRPTEPTNLPPADEAAKFIRTSQVLVAAFIAGMTMFGLASLAIAPASKPGSVGIAGTQVQSDVLFVGVGTLMLAIGLVIGATVRRAQARRMRFDADRGIDIPTARVGQAFVSTTIIRAATLEGAGLLGAVTAFITGSLSGLALLGAAILCMVITFPNRSSFENFTRDATGRPY